MSRFARIYSRISPKLADKPGSHLFGRAHARLMRLSRGRLSRFLGADVLVLRTIGRKSGEPRETPLMFVRREGGFVVVASNAAAKRTPAWWLNLQANPEAEVLASGRVIAVRAREATEEEADEAWPSLSAMYEGYDHYVSVAERRFPVVILEPR